MLYAKLEDIDKKLSRLTYGTTSRIAGDDPEAACDCLYEAYEAGFRTFDTAHLYGNGEKNFGYWIEKSGLRDQIVILDKGLNPCYHVEPDEYSGRTVREQFAQSLNDLRTDHVEMYILHRDDPSRPVDEIVDTLNALKDEGKVKRFGGSNWTMKRIKEANAYAEKHGLTGFTVCSPCFSLAHFLNDPWGGSVTISGPENADFRKWLIEKKMPVFNYSGLARGFLSGKYRTDAGIPIEECIGKAPIMEYYFPENVERLRRAEILARKYDVSVPQIAIAYLMGQKLDLFPIVAPNGAKHLKEVIDALALCLTEEELRYLENAAD